MTTLKPTIPTTSKNHSIIIKILEINPFCYWHTRKIHSKIQGSEWWKFVLERLLWSDEFGAKRLRGGLREESIKKILPLEYEIAIKDVIDFQDKW